MTKTNKHKNEETQRDKKEIIDSEERKMGMELAHSHTEISISMGLCFPFILAYVSPLLLFLFSLCPLGELK